MSNKYFLTGSVYGLTSHEAFKKATDNRPACIGKGETPDVYDVFFLSEKPRQPNQHPFDVNSALFLFLKIL